MPSIVKDADGAPGTSVVHFALASALWKTVWQFLMKFNKYLPYDPVILLLAIYLRKIKMHAHTGLVHEYSQWLYT